MFKAGQFLVAKMDPDIILFSAENAEKFIIRAMVIKYKYNLDCIGGIYNFYWTDYKLIVNDIPYYEKLLHNINKLKVFS